VTTAPARRGFLGRRGWVWTLIASWFVPAIMTGAYIVLALLADTDAIGMGWFGVGLLFVLCIWWIFRELTQTAALSRAMAIGDAEALLEISTHALAGKLVMGRTELVLYQAVAHELRGEWSDALAAVERAHVAPTAKKRLRVLADTVTIAALVETGEVAKARGVLDAELAPLAAALDDRIDAQLVVAARLARGRVLIAEHDPDGPALLQRVIDDIRAGAATRERAKQLLART
jgi:hypothetical protein